jgi:hypothetical protein
MIDKWIKKICKKKKTFKIDFQMSTQFLFPRINNKSNLKEPEAVFLVMCDPSMNKL